MSKKIIAVILSLILSLASLVSCAKLTDTNETTDSTDTSSSDSEKSSADDSDTAAEFVPEPDINADEVSVYTENYGFTNGDITFIFNSSYNSFVSYIQYYGAYTGETLESIGLDTTKSLKDQPCTYEGYEGTWYGFFMDQAKTTVNDILALCEAAKAAGHVATDEEKKELDEIFETIVNEATEANMTVDDYIAENYAGATSEVLNHVYELMIYASSYLTKVSESVDVSDAALEAAYSTNPNVIDTIDFILCSFDPNDLVPEEADEAAIEEAKNTCRTHASNIAKAATQEEFLDAVKSCLTGDFGLTEDEAQENLDAIVYESQAYSDNIILNWAFGDVAPGETKVFEDEENEIIACAYFIGRNPRNEGAVTRDVRHILFSSTTYDDDTVVKQVYNDWVTAGADLEYFETLVSKYSEDPGSTASGGLYEDVTQGEMVTEFNDWLFDPARQEGDHGIVKTSFGWHIMLAGEGEGVQWKESLKTYLKNEAVEKLSKESMEKYPVTYNEELLATLPV